MPKNIKQKRTGKCELCQRSTFAKPIFIDEVWGTMIKCKRKDCTFKTKEKHD